MSVSSVIRHWIGRFIEDRSASLAITFAFSVIPLVVLMSAAVDYGRALKTKSAMQTALDSAAMMAIKYSASSAETFATATAKAGANFRANATAMGLTFSSGPSFVSNDDGSITATASGALATGLLSLIGVSSIPMSLSATATLTHPPTPHSIVYQFQYAKGWYYKVVTLYVQQNSTSATLPLATWTYKAYNDSYTAIPKSLNNVPYFWTQAGSSPTATGIGITTTSWNATNAATVGATLDAANNKITFNQPYYDLYLTMQIANSRCAPGQTYKSASVTASDAHEAIFEAVYDKTWASAKVNENIGCSGSTSNSWSATVSTNSKTNSNWLYINGAQQASNTVLGLARAFPCAAGVAENTPVTNNYEWEDNSPVSSDTRDFFFSLTTTCSTDQWNNAPPIAKLTH